jgi:hypothetical protein
VGKFIGFGFRRFGLLTPVRFNRDPALPWKCPWIGFADFAKFTSVKLGLSVRFRTRNAPIFLLTYGTYGKAAFETAKYKKWPSQPGSDTTTSHRKRCSVAQKSPGRCRGFSFEQLEQINTSQPSGRSN